MTVSSYALTLVGLFVFYRWPTWLRNSVWLRSESAGRVVYAYPNWDIDKPSFYLQEFNALIVTILILELLKRWSFYFAQLRKELHESRVGDRNLDNNQIYMLIR
jgi:hypothetical protein